MEKYTVSIVAKISGVTIRTLQHYDKIGLLKPFERARSGYRYYSKDELYRLQQILFFKELGFSLKKINHLLDDPTFDVEEALIYQRQELEQRKARLNLLLNTIDKTIQQLKEENKMITDEELYEGFSEEEVSAWKQEVDEKYDAEVVAESYRNVKKMTKREFADVKAEQENVAKELADVMDHPIDSDVVQSLIHRHHSTNERFYKTDAVMYKGLADLYVSDPRFAEFYNKYKPGLASFLRDAMYYFANNSL
ncbi:MAG: MerR family transcriptional regulator [Balneolaceae bacterium]